jgi:nucleotide-binding universal stress UspA family protein
MPNRNRKLQRILVAIDGSEYSMRAADYAISIAYKNDAQLIALYILYSQLGYAYSPHVLGLVTPNTMKTIIDGVREEANQWFKIIRDKISGKNGDGKHQLKTDIIVTATSIVHAIVSYAEDNNVDLTVVGTRGRSGLKRVLLGSTASGVVTYSSCPVLVAK